VRGPKAEVAQQWRQRAVEEHEHKGIKDPVVAGKLLNAIDPSL
jgi:hypothetical protein